MENEITKKIEKENELVIKPQTKVENEKKTDDDDIYPAEKEHFDMLVENDIFKKVRYLKENAPEDLRNSDDLKLAYLQEISDNTSSTNGCLLAFIFIVLAVNLGITIWDKFF